jgi:SagB-type dehydrogenase family enzyme
MRRFITTVVVVTAAAFAAVALAQPAPEIKLPAPQTTGGKPLMQALKDRHTSREFSEKALPEQTLSNLLWAANGVTRPDGRRTAPTAVNWQEIDLYVALPQGTYLFDAKAHTLKLIAAEDLRAVTGRQPFVKDAPVNLVFVADHAKMTSKMFTVSEADRDLYAASDTGFVSQNVYLFCASEGLNTVVRGLVDKPALAKALKLRPEQRVILAQTVGYPKEK